MYINIKYLYTNIYRILTEIFAPTYKTYGLRVINHNKGWYLNYELNVNKYTGTYNL